MSAETFSHLSNQYLHRLDPGATLTRIWNLLSNPETADPLLVAEALNSNPAYEQLLRGSDLLKKRMGSGMEAEDSDSQSSLSSKRILALLGKSATRNAVTCMRLSRVTGQGLPRKEGEILTLNPQKTIRRALEAEDYCLENRVPHSDTAFLGGLLFDWIRSLAVLDKRASKAALQSIDEYWKEGFRCAQLSVQLGSVLKTFKYHRYAFAAGAALHLGRSLMSLIYSTNPNWSEFLKENREHGTVYGSVPYWMKEKKEFPLTHLDFASLTLAFFKPLGSIEKALNHTIEPYFLRNVHPDLFRLAVIVNVSTTLSFLQKEARASAQCETMLSPYQKRWLSEIGIPISHVQKSLKEIVEASK